MKKILSIFLVGIILLLNLPAMADEVLSVQIEKLCGKYLITAEGDVYNLLGENNTLEKTPWSNVADIQEWDGNFIYCGISRAILYRDGQLELKTNIRNNREDKTIHMDNIWKIYLFQQTLIAIDFDHYAWIMGDVSRSKEYSYSLYHIDVSYSEPTKIEQPGQIVDAICSFNSSFLMDENGDVWKINSATNVEKQSLNLPQNTTLYSKGIFVEGTDKEYADYQTTAYGISGDQTYKLQFDQETSSVTSTEVDDLSHAKKFALGFKIWWFERRHRLEDSEIIYQADDYLAMLKDDGSVWELGCLSSNGASNSSDINYYCPYDTDSCFYESVYVTEPVQIKGLSNVIDISVDEGTLFALQENGNIIKIKNGESAQSGLNTNQRTDLYSKVATVMFNNITHGYVDNKSMYLNGYRKPFPNKDTTAVIKNDRMLIPMRSLVESLGGVVDWNEETQEVWMSLWGDEVAMHVGSDIVYKNGEPIQMDVTPEIINDQVMIPVRYAAEAFGFMVDYKYGYADLIIREIQFPE